MKFQDSGVRNTTIGQGLTNAGLTCGKWKADKVNPQFPSNSMEYNKG